MKISGKCAIVTGGADGFGKALVESFVAKGAKVVFGDISINKGQELERKLNKNGKNAIFCKCNVIKEVDFKFLFQTAYEAFGGAQILINNAGIAPIENLTESTASVSSVIDVNLKAVIMGTSLAVQHFKEQNGKPLNNYLDFCIINISSASAKFPVKELSVYSTTKKGVMYFSQIMGYLKKDGIRVNCVLPGFSDTLLAKAFVTDPILMKYINDGGGFLTVSDVVKSIHQLIEDPTMAGEAFLITPKKQKFLPRVFKPEL